MQKQELHPDTEDLIAFSVGHLSAEEAAVIEAHISDCTLCCETLMGLCADDTMIALLKEARYSVDGTTLSIVNCTMDTLSGEAKSALAEHPRYEIIELIARGGMGEVFKAKHRLMNRIVALKVINSNLISNSEAVERFHREVKTAAHLSHPNIVTAFDAEQAEGVHFLVMEHVNGVNLADLIERDGAISILKACEYARQTAIGLQHAHEQGMVHRDMKPHNLMLTIDGTVKILDFGLASLASKSVSLVDSQLPKHANLTSAGTVMGTPNFISPEQAVDAHQADIRSDIYSLGATLHYLLSGQPPFTKGDAKERLYSHAEEQPASISSLREDAPQELSDIINRMMAKDPDLRYQTPEEVAEDLSVFVDAFQATAKGPGLLVNVAKSWWPPSRLLVAVFAVFSFIFASIIYLETDKGTLVIDSVDDNVKVTISQAEDAEGDAYMSMKVVDTLTGSEVKRLPSGKYKVSLGKKESDFELSQGGFKLTRGDNIVVSVTRKASQKAEQEPEPLQPLEMTQQEHNDLMIKGMNLSSKSAKELQDKADKDPSDAESRLLLMFYYHRKSILTPEMREPHRKIVKWFVKNYPASFAAGNHAASFYTATNPEGYVEVKQLWLKQVERNNQNVAILRNASKYFMLADKKLSEELLLQAQDLAPDDAGVSKQLAQVYKLGMSRLSGDKRKERAVESLAKLEATLSQNKKAKKNNYLLADIAKMALEAGAIEKAEQYANRLLETEDQGRALHDGNIVLGRLAMQSGDLEKAKLHLLASGKTNGGPTLNSFGPDMVLAKKLLEKGEKETVLEYFQLCSQFWKPKNNKLQKWTEEVRRGGIPDLGDAARFMP